ncbi:MAG: serine/threonine-protein kinase [Planctomycetota bacterium]
MGLFDRIGSLFSKKLPPATQFLAEYKIKRELTGGTMSKILLAKHIKTGHLRAIKKVTPKTKESLDNLKRELSILLDLDHHHVAHCYAYQQEGDSWYILMEYAVGTSFRDYLRDKILHVRRRPPFLPYPHFLEIFRQVADGLKYIHMKDILHLDIKPENLIFIKPPAVGGTGKKATDTTLAIIERKEQATEVIRPQHLDAKIIDFGVSVRGSELTEAVGGSIFYVAPEVLAPKEVRAVAMGPHSDVWSLGATFLELATGSPPQLPLWFHGKEQNWNFHWVEYQKLPRAERQQHEAEMLAQRRTTPPDLSALRYPDEMKRVFAKCLEPLIPKRYKNSAELLRDLEVIHRRLWPTG